MPSDSAKDIQLLFSRAGMIGAKYREFPRQEPIASVAAVSIEAERNGSHSGMSIVSPPATASKVEASAPPAQSPASPPPFRDAGATSSTYTSLERIFADGPIPTPVEPAARAGVKLAILSLAGGVGKTTLAVTLARILSGMHRQTLVADCGIYPNAPHHFGSRAQRIGPLQFFFPPCKSAPLPIGVFNLSEDNIQDTEFQDLIEQVNSSETMMLMDLPTLQGSMPSEALAYAGHVLVPVTPDIHSVSGVAHLKAMLSASAGLGHRPPIHYLINRFDESRALHREVKDRLRQLLGESLLPFVVHENETIEEAAAHGMTVVDHCPESPAVREFAAVANWLCDLSGDRRKSRKEGLA
jgi:cellulose biosynthesis protein BcsQ